MKKRERIIRNILQLIAVIVIIAIVGYLSSIWFFRIDLTSEKRYTLSYTTLEVLENLPGEVYVQVYLDGEMPIGFKKMRTSVAEMLDEFRVRSKRKLRYEFINPAEETDKGLRDKVFEDLYEKGLQPINVQSNDEEGGKSQKIIFPGAILNYNGLEMPLNLLKSNPNLRASENLNRSIEGLEYELVRAIKTLSTDTIYKVAFIEGHGELFEPEVEDASKELSRYYTIDRGIIGGKPGVLDAYKAVIIAKPTEKFTEADKLILDQYLMNGGSLLWLLDPVAVDMDSLINSSVTLAFIRQNNLDDQLFKYGVRINPNLLQDIQCARIPINTAIVGNPPQYTPMPWLFSPLLQGQNHSISRNLNLIKSEFTSSIDTISGNGKTRSSVLLTTSPYTKTFGVPNLINLNDLRKPPPESDFTLKNIPVAILVEGEFESAFRNRMVSSIVPGIEQDFIENGKPAKMIVVSDGDIIRNEVRIQGDRVVAMELGKDRFTQQTYGNKDFIVNCVNYLVDDPGLMQLRSRELRIRLLDKSKISAGRFSWQLINTLLPILLVVIFGSILGIWKKRKYTAL
ncbi:MAG: gliding motility-associated ABC transporter substrate-binding protein GldG [Bacteroidales bacterium]|nr:gliding motility-associated ABC transporter substrate-binding protein GldG [Bacteroidales bacterium]